MVVTGAGDGGGRRRSKVNGPDPIAAGLSCAPRARTFQQPGTGSHRIFLRNDFQRRQCVDEGHGLQAHGDNAGEQVEEVVRVADLSRPA